jgi:hypothetical protein
MARRPAIWRMRAVNADSVPVEAGFARLVCAIVPREAHRRRFIENHMLSKFLPSLFRATNQPHRPTVQIREDRKSIRPRRYQPQLELLEDRTVPALITTGGSLWFYQNLKGDPALMKEALTLWQQGNNTFQYSDMVKLFEFVANEGPTVSQTDLTGLQNLISYAYSVGRMPQSVWYLSSQVVNYNQSNYYYQFAIDSSGNPPSSPTLLPNGMLQAGDSSVLLQELVDKWFLGMDHPDMADNSLNSSGDLAGLSAIGFSSSTYLPASGVLWGPGGPVTQDVEQNYLGDCFFLSSLASTVAEDPKAIESMFTYDGSYQNQDEQTISIYTVRFYMPNSTGTQFTPAYVTVDTYLPFYYSGGGTYQAGTYPAGYYFEFANGGPSPAGPNSDEFGNETNLNTGPVQGLNPAYPNPVNHLWVPLLEKAYAQLNSQVPLSLTPLGSGYNLPVGANSYYLMDGGDQANSFGALAGTGTNFTAADKLIGNASIGYYEVTSVQSTTALTLYYAPGMNFNHSSYSVVTSLGTAGAGTIRSNGAIVTGDSSTDFTGLAEGDLIGNTSDGYYAVLSVQNAHQLTLATTPGYGFTSGSSYNIIQSNVVTTGPGTITSTISTYGALSEITGRSSTFLYFPSEAGSLTNATLQSLLNAHDAVTLSSYDTKRSKANQNIVKDHVYFVVGYTIASSYTYEGTTYTLPGPETIYTVINPWGFDNTNEGKAGTLTLPFENGTDPSLNSFYEDVGYASL